MRDLAVAAALAAVVFGAAFAAGRHLRPAATPATRASAGPGLVTVTPSQPEVSLVAAAPLRAKLAVVPKPKPKPLVAPPPAPVPVHTYPAPVQTYHPSAPAKPKPAATAATCGVSCG